MRLQSLTGSEMSKPWTRLAAEVGEMGSALGTSRLGMGMGMAAEAEGERYGAIGTSVSGERNGRGSGELARDEGT